jgi:hypothetical protein
MSNAPQFCQGGNDLTHGVLKNTSIRVLIPFRFLVELCNTPLIVKIYMTIHLAFLGYRRRGTTISLHPSDHEQYHSYNIGQNESTHGVLQSTPI